MKRLLLSTLFTLFAVAAFAQKGTVTGTVVDADDLIEGMVRMMDDTPDDFTGPVNIGNPNEFTIAELAREVISLTGSKSKIVHLPLPADDPQQRQPDISLARNMLGGWEPKIQLRDGLLKTIAYFEEVLSRGGIRR